MLQHVVAITWNDQVPPNYAETVSAVLQEMASHISSVREYHCGPDSVSYTHLTLPTILRV